jgi:hypothetical protein
MRIKIPKDFAIIVHGLINEQLLDDLKPIKNNVIFSCWSNCNLDFEDYNIIKKEEPSDDRIGNIVKQSKSVLYGCQLAKKLGFKRVLKIRGDMFIKNKEQLLTLLDNNILNLFSWHFCESVSNSKGYVVDYFMSGKIEDIEYLWDIDLSLNYTIAEQYITHNFFKLVKEKNVNYRFILDDISENNDIFWSKKNIILSSYNFSKFEYDGDLSDKNFIKNTHFGSPLFSKNDLYYFYKFHKI